MRYIKTFITDLYASFFNSPGGFSARKLSAFLCFAVACYATYKFTTAHNVTTVLLIWLACGLLCLGIVTMEQIINFKTGKNETGSNNTSGN